MSKAKKIKIGICLALVLTFVGGSVVYYSAANNVSGEITEEAARRDKGVPADGVVYIEPEMVSLASSLSGSAESQSAAKAAFDMINTQRKSAGLKALTWNSGLETAASVRAVEASEVWSHTRPNGSDYWTVNSNLVYAENLAKCYTTADTAVDAWMASPGHKANIMDNELATGAIAIHISADGSWYWAQEFGL